MFSSSEVVVIFCAILLLFKKNELLRWSKSFIKIDLWGRLEELQKVLLRVFLVVAIGMLCSFAFSKPLVGFFTRPLEKSEKFQTKKWEKIRASNSQQKFLTYSIPPQAEPLKVSSSEVKKLGRGEYFLPPGTFVEYYQPAPDDRLNLFSPPEGLILTLQTSFWVGLVGTSPLWALFILNYLAPSTKRKTLLTFFLFSFLFLGLGFFVGYHAIIPATNHYFLAFNESLGRNFWTLTNYLEYTRSILLATGLIFEMSALFFLLVYYKWISVHGMKKYRRAAFIGFLLISALVTPPSAISQLLFALPLMALYELAVLYARLRQRKRSTSHKKATTDYLQ